MAMTNKERLHQNNDELIVCISLANTGGGGAGGKDPVLTELTVTKNGVYKASEHSEDGEIVDGFSEVTVEIPSDIIDVTEFPTENVDQDKIYRVTKEVSNTTEIWFNLSQWDLEEWGLNSNPVSLATLDSLDERADGVTIIHEVDSLPEVGERYTWHDDTNTFTTHYYILTNNPTSEAYLYTNGNWELLSDWWYGPYNGIVNSLESVTEEGYYIVKQPVYEEYYGIPKDFNSAYKYSTENWEKVDTVIDVGELPTENINNNKIYKVIEETLVEISEFYFVAGDGINTYKLDQMLADIGISQIRVHVVGTAPEIGAAFGALEEGEPIAHIYISTTYPEAGAAVYDGYYWYSFTEFILYKMNWGNFPFLGTITNFSEIDYNAEGYYIVKRQVPEVNTAYGIPTKATIYEYNGDYGWEKLDGNSADDFFAGTLTELNSNAKNVGQYVFCHSLSLTSVNFPRAISIGQYAFKESSVLTSASFQNATTIDQYAFLDCSNLSNIDFPNVTTIGRNAFTRCRGLTSINFPQATTIEQEAFKNCYGLISADFPMVKTVGNYMFSGCNALTNVHFPRATKIGGSSFSSCTSLTSADYPLVTELGSYAFSNCSNLVSVNLPDAETLYSNVFEYCFKLTNINLPNAYYIYQSAFKACRSLETLKLPKASYLLSSALSSCSSLRAIILPSTSICRLDNTNVFSECCHFLGTTTTVADGTVYNPNGDKDGYIYVPSALVDSYKSATNWSAYADRFRALEDYTVDGTTTGELDPNKI